MIEIPFGGWKGAAGIPFGGRGATRSDAIGRAVGDTAGRSQRGAPIVSLIPADPGHRGVIRIVWGTGHGRARSASLDAALAAAGVHQYNLRRLSSVIPSGAELASVGSAPDLGSTGNALDVAMARATSASDEPAVAGMAWARDGSEGPGVFSEVSGSEPDGVAERLRAGVERSCELRGVDDPGVERRVVTADPSSDRYATAVVLAAYGESEPLL